MLNLYQIFHINLMYSSIDEEDYLTVINNCYHPLLDLAETGVPIGIELSGLSLELIQSVDSKWVDRFRELLKDNKVELIGSGYSQIIGPIVPSEVNYQNQKLGLEVYQKLLGQQPDIALINEMSFSAGLVTHYLDNGYEAVIMEFNNPLKFHLEWDKNLRYYPQRILGTNKSVIKLLWADSIAFQKFQRFVHAEISLADYEKYLNTFLAYSPRYFPLYANDVEIFNFRPGRYKSEAQLSGENEWQRISGLYKFLREHENFSLVFPSQVIDTAGSLTDHECISLESPEQPIPVKKQRKYNINRWTLSGRNDLKINTQCFGIFTTFNKREKVSKEQWKELCYLWSSDFRTHITNRRWEEFEARLQAFYDQFSPSCSKAKAKPITHIENLPYSGNNIQVSENEHFLQIKNDKSTLILNKKKGIAIESYFPQGITNNPVFGTLAHGYYDDIAFGADFFSGHAVIERIGRHKTTDLCKPKISINHDDKDIHICSEVTTDNISLNTKLSLTPSMLIIEKEISLPERMPEIIRPFHFTFHPESFDVETLYYATNNGGEELEYFNLFNSTLQHHNILSPLISSEHGLGATKGIVIIGDQEKKIVFKHDLTSSALIPSLEYQQFEEGRFFLRLVYSAQELDETFKPHGYEYLIISKVEISILAGKN